MNPIVAGIGYDFIKILWNSSNVLINAPLIIVQNSDEFFSRMFNVIGDIFDLKQESANAGDGGAGKVQEENDDKKALEALAKAQPIMMRFSKSK